jgi:isopentenyl phosphate kinase
MIFLKLGGSLITDKTGKEIPRPDVLSRLAGEIAEAYIAKPDMKLLLGHGSGSFGHRAAERYGTHKGAKSKQDWLGFSEVGAAANRLHRIVINAMQEAGLAAISFPPSSMLITANGEISSYAVTPILSSLGHGLLPIVYGDVAFDTQRGSSIVSTEQVMAYLADHLSPSRFLLAGKEPGILNRDGDILGTLKPQDLDSLHFHDPDGADVTGGMRTKVHLALSLSTRFPDMEVFIFSAESPGVLRDVLRGGTAGTRILNG